VRQTWARRNQIPLRIHPLENCRRIYDVIQSEFFRSAIRLLGGGMAEIRGGSRGRVWAKVEW